MRLHCFILAKTIAAGGCALALTPAAIWAESGDAPSAEPLVVLTDFADFGQSLLVAPATVSEQLDAAEMLDRELGPQVTNEEIPSGRWKARPHLEARIAYDDNIFIQPDHRVEDFIFTLSPGVAIGIWDSEKRRTDGFLDQQTAASAIDKGRGSYFLLDYTAILLGFAKTDSQNAFDQDARLDARWQGEKWTISGVVHFESKSETNTDIGTRIRRQTISAEAIATYRVSEKTTLETSVAFRENDPEDYVRTTGWKVESFASYALTPIVRIGVGGAVGGVQIEGGADDFYERVLAQASYACSEKLELELRGGVEFRQSNGAAGDRTNPIFSFLARYAPAEGTNLVLEAFRSVETSEFRPEESYERTGFTASFRRAIRPGIHGQLDGGYRVSDYTGRAEDAGRRDEYWFVRPGLLYDFADWGTAGLTYEFRQNDSNRPVSNFENNQMIFQMNFWF